MGCIKINGYVHMNFANERNVELPLLSSTRRWKLHWLASTSAIKKLPALSIVAIFSPVGLKSKSEIWLSNVSVIHEFDIRRNLSIDYSRQFHNADAISLFWGVSRHIYSSARSTQSSINGKQFSLGEKLQQEDSFVNYTPHLRDLSLEA